jgi:glycine/D-amino acid oxidase-like deaminating enzyme
VEVQGARPGIPLAPRKGQILSLTTQNPFRVMVRWNHAYIVPRGHEVVVGATNEDAGFDRRLTPAGIGGLLKAAQKLSAGLAGSSIRDMWSGLRPATPDGLPIIGNAALDGLIYATGHYRNGILLAPITAQAVASLAAGQAPDLPLEPFEPSRFAV